VVAEAPAAANARRRPDCTALYARQVPEAVAPLPDHSILLHIGPHKTGTTAIQGALAASRDEMAEAGVSYVGKTPAHHAAARALRRHPAGWSGDAEPTPDDRVWRRFARRANETSGLAVASSEFFAQCNAEERAQVAADLDRDRLHLLVAARNPGSIAISTWQQVLRNGAAVTLDEWLGHHFRRPEHAVADNGFWAWADAATLVAAWSEVIDLDRIHLVVIDESDKALLPSTFEQLLGLPAGLLAARTTLTGNRGLTAPEAELLRQTIALTKDRLTWAEFSPLLRVGFSRQLVQERKPAPDEPCPKLPEWAAAQAAAEAAATIDRLSATGVDVIGDLESLRAVPASGGPADLRVVPTELAAHGAAGVVNGAVRELEHARRATAEAEAAAALVRGVDDISTRELAAVLRSRVVAGARRRLPGGRTRT
jgi:hypothetical protein